MSWVENWLKIKIKLVKKWLIMRKDISSQMTNFRLPYRKNLQTTIKLDENGEKFSEMVENTMGKGETACYKQFLLIPQCFQKTCHADT